MESSLSTERPQGIGAVSFTITNRKDVESVGRVRVIRPQTRWVHLERCQQALVVSIQKVGPSFYST